MTTAKTRTAKTADSNWEDELLMLRSQGGCSMSIPRNILITRIRKTFGVRHFFTNSTKLIIYVMNIAYGKPFSFWGEKEVGIKKAIVVSACVETVSTLGTLIVYLQTWPRSWIRDSQWTYRDIPTTFRFKGSLCLRSFCRLTKFYWFYRSIAPLAKRQVCKVAGFI